MLFSDLRSRGKALVPALAIPAIGICVLDFYLWNTTPPAGMDQLIKWAVLLNLLILLSCVLWGLIAISCHRVLLNDTDRLTIIDGIQIGRRQLKYMLRAIIVALPLVVSGASWLPLSDYLWGELGGAGDTPGPIQTTVHWAVLIPLQYLSSRIALTLPAAAIQNPISFAEAWSLSRGNGWRITAVILSAPAAYGVFALILDPILRADSVAMQTILTIASLPIGVIVVGALSLSYRWIIENAPQQTERVD
jgi:hypothetical protein